MGINKKNKDNLKEHGNIALIFPVAAPKSDDPLRFWTNHPKQNTLVDLHPFVDGKFHSNSTGKWSGQFTGRPKLIEELAPALQARLTLAMPASVKNYQIALRAWWRLFDWIESAPICEGSQIARVESVADLNELHETAAHRTSMNLNYFSLFTSIVNDARVLLHLPALLWVRPNQSAQARTLISEDQARELKIALKQDWERVRRIWVRNDVIREEAERQAAGEIPSPLTREEERLLKNWQHFQRIQQKSGRLLPKGEQLLDGKFSSTLCYHGLERKLMRGLIFPTVEEADIAFHLALMNSGWNPSTLANLDASSQKLVFDHPKNDREVVLSIVDEQDEEVTMQANKPRARGKTQFCTGLKKNPSSPPMIVAAYLRRVELLREQLKSDCQAAIDELACMQTTGANEQEIEGQYMLLQKLMQGCRSVWLYVDLKGHINWIDYRTWKRYKPDGSRKMVSYLDLLLERLNARRAQIGKEAIAAVTPADFRDIYARWVYVQSGGNILAVMLALGHSTLQSTANYVDNNIFTAENEENARKFIIHLFDELHRGRIDLTILSHLVQHGPLTPDMESRLTEFRQLMRSRVGVGCADPRHPPFHVAPNHQEGRLCGTQRCLQACPHAKFLPESMDGIAMRVEELQAISDQLPRETWLQSGFEDELQAGEALLVNLYMPETVVEARDKWRMRIAQGQHVVPGVIHISSVGEAR